MRLTYLIVLLSAILMYFFFSEYVAFLFLIITIVLLVALVVVNFVVACHLSVKLLVKNNVTTLGQGVPIEIIIDNRSIFPLLHGKLLLKMKYGFLDRYDDCRLDFAVPARNSVIIQTELKTKHCGKATCLLYKISAYDFMGITKFSRKIKKQEDTVTFPSAYLISDAIALEAKSYLDSIHFMSDKQGDDISQVFDYRDFQQGDSLKIVNWKLSARLDKLMVKEFSQMTSNAVLLFLEINLNSDEKSLSEFDMELEILTWIAERMLQQKNHFGVGWNDWDSEIIREEPIQHSDDLLMVIEEIYEMKIGNAAEQTVSFFDFSKFLSYQSILYITTQIDDILLFELMKVSDEKQISVIYISTGNEISPEIIVEFQLHNIFFVEIDFNEIKELTEDKTA